MFVLFTPNAMQVGAMTTDEAFCAECQPKLTVKELLTDATWQNIQWRLRLDHKQKKLAFIPKLARNLTSLNWRMFKRIETKINPN